jgi:hypothetical protein
MEDICMQMSNLNISTELLLNVEEWDQDQLDFQGIYKELITANKIYKIYSYGRIFAVNGLQFIKVKHIKLIKKGNDTMVVVSY